MKDHFATAREIAREITDIPVADTHEHLWSIPDLRPGMSVIGFLGHSYLSRNLRESDGSANGLSEDLAPAFADTSFANVKDIVERVRFTAYYRWMIRALADLYDLPSPEMTEQAFDLLTEELPRRYADDNWLALLLTRANIRAVIWDPNWRPGLWQSPDPRLLPSFRLNSAVASFHPEASDSEGNNLIRDWAERFDTTVDSLTDLESLIDQIFVENVKAGSRSIKSAIAYDRTLAVGPSSRKAAARIFGTRPEAISMADRLTFGDYIIRFFLDRCRQDGLVAQIHTGIARLSGSNPLLMEPLLQEFPDVTFDLFHGGYPWIHEVAALAHNYPNVRLNLTWLPHLSTEAAIGAIKEWLQVVPQADRISWGGDCRTGEEAYAALLAARHALAFALGDLVDQQYFDRETALEAATSILWRGGAAIYRLDDVIT